MPKPLRCPLCHSAGTQVYIDDLREYFQCSNCQLVFVRPDEFLSPNEEKARYDLHENDPADAGYQQFLAQVLTPLLPQLSRGMQGLDFGCGPGPALKHLLEQRGMHMQVYDPYYANDETALERQYDFVTCTEVVEHFYDPAKDWRRLAGLVKPGGWLAVMTSLLLPTIEFSTWYYPTEPSHVMFYTPQTMFFLAEELELRLEFLDSPVILFSKTG